MAIVPPLPYADTPDLPDLPPLALWVLGEHLEPILAWVAGRVMRPMFQRCADHPLVALHAWYDPADAVAACAGFHHPEGTPGKPPDYTIAQLVRMEIVRSWAGSCSERALEQLLSTDFLVRWFVGLPLMQRGPDHSTLADFHAYVSDHAPDALFRDSLTFLDQVDPEPPDQTPQIVDTFAMESPVTPTRSTAYLLAQLSLRLIAAWEQLAPAALQWVIPPLDYGPLTRFVALSDPVDHQARRHACASVATWLLEGITPHLPTLADGARAVIPELRDTLATALTDNLMRDASDQWVERPPKQRGQHRIASAVDREATFRKHTGQPAVLGTNAVISTTATRIRACVALTGSVPDGEAPTAVLQQQRDADQPLPPYLVIDRAGGWGKSRARAHAVSDGQTTLVARIPTAGGSDPTRFTLADFRIDPDVTTCRCPNGVVSIQNYPRGDGSGVDFRYRASDCQGCAFWSQCRDPDANPTGHRSVFISTYHPFLRDAAAFNATPEGRALLWGRWRVEPVVAWLVQWQGCRRARRIGTAAAQCQLYQACAVRNLLSWLSRVRRGLAPRPPTMITRIVPDLRLAPTCGPVAACAAPGRIARFATRRPARSRIAAHAAPR
ncbi:transposase [Oscillochloris sp. ZM17-4]|uniref:transposase n=1 Tax=Oscillochloris sp. ZM17-4 TaxID=2866714 RepID=UPI001C73D88B|nr:transposase [Oscillochloris sp. ZM17-4]MBX0331362.1 transposase [Oscillochloris sp. ZM17-4]